MWLCMNNKHKYNRILNAHTHRPFASDLHDELFDNSFVGWLLLLCSSTKWRKNNVEYVAYGVCVCLCVVYFIIICSNGPHIPRSVSHSLSNYLTLGAETHTHTRARSLTITWFLSPRGMGYTAFIRCVRIGATLAICTVRPSTKWPTTNDKRP